MEHDAYHGGKLRHRADSHVPLNILPVVAGRLGKVEIEALKSMHRAVLLFFLAVFLGGWTSAADALKSQSPPTAALKRAIVFAARDYLLDPYSVRDAEISSVVTINQKKQVTGVCVKANAKNRFGAYVGRKPVGVVLVKGKPYNAFQSDPMCFARGLRWYPFPELERR